MNQIPYIYVVIIGAVSALISGIGVKFADSFFGRKDREFTQNSQIREELREENQDLVKRIENLEQRLDALRTDYFLLVEKVIKAYRDEHLTNKLVTELSVQASEQWYSNPEG